MSVLDRADVDTDQIIPKQFLKRVERTGFGEFLFYDWAKEPGWDLPPNPILVTGRNFGCGSSREHAPWALEDYGFKAIVAPSFADIFYSNCTKIGLLPVVLAEDEVAGVMDGREAKIDLAAQEVRFDGREVRFEIDPETKRRLLDGLDDIGVTLQQQDAIDAYEGERERQGPVTTSAEHDAATGTPRPTTASRRRRWSGRAVLERLPLRGDETVLDAGCGAGRVTAAAARAAAARARGRRRRRAVDGRAGARGARPASAPRSSRPTWRSWSSTSRSTPCSRTPSSTGSPTTTRCSPACTRRCGRAAGWWRSAGERATSSASTTRRAVGAEQPFAEHLGGWEGPWNFAGAEETRERLERAGFDGRRDLARALAGHAARARPSFLRTVCLGHHLERLPEELRGAVRRARSPSAAATRRARLRAPEHQARGVGSVVPDARRSRSSGATAASLCSASMRRNAATRSPSRWPRSSWRPARSSTAIGTWERSWFAARAASSAPAATRRRSRRQGAIRPIPRCTRGWGRSIAHLPASASWRRRPWRRCAAARWAPGST